MSRRIVLVAAVLVAIAAAFWFGRSSVAPAPGVAGVGSGEAGPDANDTASVQTPGTGAVKATHGAALPAPGTPLKSVFAQLQARARNGDADAATRLYRDLGRCSHLRGSEWRNADAADDLTRHKTEGMTEAQLRTYQTLLDAQELRQQDVRQTRTLCAGVGDDMLDALVPSIAQAARLGDEEARACYLGRGPLYDTRSLLKHPESLRDYRGNATALMQAGLAAGDWKVVDLLQQAYEPGAQGLLASVVGNDPVQHYRYLKLYRLGAEAHRAAKLDQELATAAESLTSGQLTEADDWAQESLRQRFQGNSTSATPEGWESCAF